MNPVERLNAGAVTESGPDSGLNSTFSKGMIRANWNTLKITARIVKIKKGITNHRNGLA
jgi:hypothetical protein